MVIFIFCLLMIMLAIIATIHFLIERPRKRRLKHLRDYLNRKAHSFFQATGSQGSVAALKVGSTPSIIVTDFGTHYASLSAGQQQQQQRDDEASETDALLPHTAYTDPAKITFSVGETIVEETASFIEDTRPAVSAAAASVVVVAAAAPPATTASVLLEEPVAAVELEMAPPPPVVVTTAAAASNQEETIGNVEEVEDAAEKTLSHLLDNKPWSTTTSTVPVHHSQSAVITRRDSKEDKS